MLIGTYYHTLEEKGRVAVPSKFREDLGKTVFITRGLDGGLFLFSNSEWMKFIEDLQQAVLNKKAHRDFVRLMTNEAYEVEIDSQGRILLPENLKKNAEIKKKVVFTGSLNKVELWDQDKYHQYISALEQNAEEIAEAYEPAGRIVRE